MDQFPGIVGCVEERDDNSVGTGVEGTCIINVSYSIPQIDTVTRRKHIRLTIHASFAATRTIGLTPVAAMAATASCI